MRARSFLRRRDAPSAFREMRRRATCRSRAATYSVRCSPTRKASGSFVSYLRETGDDGDMDVGSVGISDAFGLLRVGGSKAGNGFQISIAGSVFAQFDLNTSTYDLINADYTIGTPDHDPERPLLDAPSCLPPELSPRRRIPAARGQSRLRAREHLVRVGGHDPLARWWPDSASTAVANTCCGATRVTSNATSRTAAWSCVRRAGLVRFGTRRRHAIRRGW